MFIQSSDTSPLTDSELLDKYRNTRNTTYIGELFKRYTHLVLGVCIKYLGNEEESKDAVMEIFEKLLKEIQNHEITHFKSWLYSVAKNHCLMQLRKEQALLTRQLEYQKNRHAGVESEGGAHLNHKAAETSSRQLMNAMAVLNNEQKRCIELFYLQEKSYKEIEETTGYSFKQIKSHIQNGKRNLKIYLEKKHE